MTREGESGGRPKYQGWKKPRFFQKVFRFLGFLGFIVCPLSNNEVTMVISNQNKPELSLQLCK